jgi:YihY family inner membrane protein
MATRRQAASNTARRTADAAAATATGGAFTMKNFFKKVSNDWTLHQTQALSYSLIGALVPMAILLLAIVGFILNGLDHHAYTQLINHLGSSSGQFASQQVLTSAANKLAKASGALAILAVIAALIFGSRLFTLLEECFDLIYHVPPRAAGPKNGLAIVMTIVAVILIPVVVLASVIPGQVVGFLQRTAINASSGMISNIIGIIVSLIVSFILFEIMYAVIPNRQGTVEHRIRLTWKGALVAAVILQVCLILFPLYIRFFTKGYVGQIAFVLILLVFFYLISLAMLLGAQVNAFFVERIRGVSTDLITRSSRN